MSLLFRIIYAAHANGTHHKLALDALPKLQHRDADAWQKVFLEHVALYLEGSKDPDNKFKDFKNHVLHVSDNYWGGAPEKVESWYAHTVAALKESRWSEAVYAAGVLSHYYTDPIHPFHTGQTEAENNIHRAAEWSINRSYDALKKLGDENFSGLTVEVPQGTHWLKEMTCDGAEFSHRYYEKLIAHYDIHRGVTDPPSGLDTIAQRLVAELITYASTGFARILDRALADAAVSPPAVNLTLDTVIAGLKIPLKMVQKRMANAAERELVQSMYDELKTTGRVEATLSEDDRMVRDLHAKEVLAPRLAAQAEARAKRLPQVDPVKSPALLAKAPAVAPAASAAPVPQQRISEMVTPLPAAAPLTISLPRETAALPAAAPVSEIQAIPASSVPEVKPKAAQAPRCYLVASDDLESAPSIGPKMAERFAAISITTVGQFLAADAGEMSARLALRLLTPDILEDWQHQARLVMSVPGLRGTHAQLLVGAGYRDADSLAAADPATLSSAVLNFAVTSEGQRILREGNPPDIEKIKSWIDNAKTAKAA